MNLIRRYATWIGTNDPRTVKGKEYEILSVNQGDGLVSYNFINEFGECDSATERLFSNPRTDLTLFGRIVESIITILKHFKKGLRSIKDMDAEIVYLQKELIEVKQKLDTLQGQYAAVEYKYCRSKMQVDRLVHMLTEHKRRARRCRAITGKGRAGRKRTA